ncbi:MAG: hypothetical protein A07HR60_02385 [uncultured archaeon A07HR60]|nr:MAG: hypothetical protein A07HR60_02385 [uncultured archaeon A07HR60]
MVAVHALRALKRVGLAPGDDAGSLVLYVDMPEIRSMLTDEYGDVRADALEVLITKCSARSLSSLSASDHKTIGELLPHIQECLTHSHDRCRRAAAQTLVRFDYTIFESVDEPGIVVKPFDMITETRYELEADPLLTALESDLPDVKSDIAWILREWTNPAELADIGVSAESLREFLDSDDEEVRKQGLLLLAEIAVVTPDEVRPLVDALESQLRETRPAESVPPRSELLLREAHVDEPERIAAMVLALVARIHPEVVDLKRIYSCALDNLDIAGTFDPGPGSIVEGLTRSELDTGPVQTFVTQLWSLLTDESSHTAARMLRTIEGIAESRPEAARPIAEELQTILFETPDTIAADNSTMAKALTHVAVMHPEELQLAELVQHSDADIRDSAIETVKRAAKSHPTELPLTALAQYSDAGIRDGIIKTVEETAESRLTELPLAALAQHNNADIRDSVIETVGKTVESQSGQEAVEPIRELARGNPTAACQFVGELEQALDDSSRNARRLAVEALAAIAKADPESVRPMRDELLRLVEDATVIQQHAEVILTRIATPDHMEPWWTLPLIGQQETFVSHTETLIAQSECTVDCTTHYFDGIVEMSVAAPDESLLLRVSAGEALTDRASYEVYDIHTDQASEQTDRELHAEYTEFDQAIEHWEGLLENRFPSVDR